MRKKLELVTSRERVDNRFLLYISKNGIEVEVKDTSEETHNRMRIE